jgi:hypothetical protein
MSIPNAAPAAAPAAPQISNDEQISNFARGVLDDIVKDDNTAQLDPNVREDQAPAEDAPQAEADTETPEQEAETPALPDVPLVEVEVDGEKFQIPEKVKHRVMADKDYRQKTMEVAAQRKQLEQHTATAQKIVEQAQQLAPLHAQLFQMDSRADQLGRALQSPELQNDPLTFNRVQGELAILLHNRERFAQGLQQRALQLDSERTRLRGERLAAEAPELFKEFPELAKPEGRDQLAKYVSESNLPPEALEFINYSPVAAKLAWKASRYDQMVKDNAANAKKLTEKVKTLPAAQTSRASADQGAKNQQLQRQWQKNGGKISDPAFDQLLRSKLKG